MLTFSGQNSVLHRHNFSIVSSKFSMHRHAKVPPSCPKRSAETLKMPQNRACRGRHGGKCICSRLLLGGSLAVRPSRALRLWHFLGHCCFFPPAHTISIHTPFLCHLPSQPGARQLCHPLYPRYLWSMKPELPSPAGPQGCASSLYRAFHCLVPGPLPHCVFCSLKAWLSCRALSFFLPTFKLWQQFKLCDNNQTTRLPGYPGDRGNFLDDRDRVS